MQENAGNYQENIHLADFEAQYRQRLITAESLIQDATRPHESLNGPWHYGADQYDTCLRAKWFEEVAEEEGRPLPLDYSFDSWPTLPVPACWNLQEDTLFHYEGSVVYTRTFRYTGQGERVFLKFGGVAGQAAVFVNRRFMGLHQGGSTPFNVEITGVVQAENRVLVVANNTRRRTAVPCENTDWFNYGGIYRDVKLLRLPETFIQRFTLALVPGSGFGQARCTLRVNGPAADGTAVLRIDELGVQQEIAVVAGQGSAVFAIRPELWRPGSPKLYDAVVEYAGDTLADRVGFREIQVEGTEVRLNGESIFLKGVCAHEESVQNGKAVTEEEIRENYRLAKEMGCNYMRLAHYPHREEAARIADEVGLLLWEEIPVYWAIDFENPATLADAQNQLAELVCRDMNRASVVIWSVGNENADTDARLRFMRALAETAKRLDETRLVSAACLVDHEKLKITDRLAQYIDIIGINEYYGWYMPDFGKLETLLQGNAPPKPVVITEFGADGVAGSHGTRDDMFTEEHQLGVYERQLAILATAPYIRGISPWILFDFRCPRRLHTQQGYYNRKGLLNAGKTHKKLAFYAMQRFYAILDSSHK